MSTASPPKKPPPPAPPPKTGSPAVAPAAKRDFRIEEGVVEGPQRVVILGPGGIGKSSLCASLSDVGIKPLFVDIGDGSRHLNVARLHPQSWQETRDILHDDKLWQGFGAVVIDDLTKAQELATVHTLATIKHEKGHFVDRIEAYGYGKGFTFVYETFLQLLGDLDQHIRADRQVVCVAHDEVVEAPNPLGEDFLRYEMRLQSQKNGNIRARVKEWADHVVFIGYDLAVNDAGKAIGAGTRTIYVQERPAWIAKSRSLSDNIVYRKGDAEFWRQLLNKE